MSYKVNYKLKDIKQTIEDLEKRGKKSITLEVLLKLIGFNPVDVNFFYIQNVRSRIRYNQEKG